MTTFLKNAKIVPVRSAERGHANHGWLNTYHTFSFSDYYNQDRTQFGALRVLNEDRVAPKTGFPTHPHRNAEIFSYILSGELTHRDSMMTSKSADEISKDDFSRLARNDVQFTTGGRGIAHSEQNEHSSKTVHFLQIWALPWSQGLIPAYHTSTFPQEDKREGFVTIISPLKAGKGANAAEEKAAVPIVEGSIPIHADLFMGAAIIEPGKTFEWAVGANDAALAPKDRKIYVHVPMTKSGKAKVKINDHEDSVLEEGDGAMITGLNAGQKLSFESVGEEEVEFVVLDSNN
jgi:redox-sensitive bicupin YhaK (pirin superfamily)